MILALGSKHLWNLPSIESYKVPVVMLMRWLLNLTCGPGWLPNRGPALNETFEYHHDLQEGW